MAVQYSIQKMVSDGTLSTIALGIQYLQRNDIYIRIAEEETPQSGAPSGYTWSFLDNTTLKILPVVPKGVEVVVYRRTDVDAMYNIYSQNAQFDEATIDENNQQLLYIAQEYLEQGIPGAGVSSLEYINTVSGVNYYRFLLTDGTYTTPFGVPDGTGVLRSELNSSVGASIIGIGNGTVADAIKYVTPEMFINVAGSPTAAIQMAVENGSFIDMSGRDWTITKTITLRDGITLNIGSSNIVANTGSTPLFSYNATSGEGLTIEQGSGVVTGTASAFLSCIGRSSTPVNADYVKQIRLRGVHVSSATIHKALHFVHAVRQVFIDSCMFYTGNGIVGHGKIVELKATKCIFYGSAAGTDTVGIQAISPGGGSAYSEGWHFTDCTIDNFEKTFDIRDIYVLTVNGGYIGCNSPTGYAMSFGGRTTTHCREININAVIGGKIIFVSEPKGWLAKSKISGIMTRISSGAALQFVNNVADVDVSGLKFESITGAGCALVGNNCYDILFSDISSDGSPSFGIQFTGANGAGCGIDGFVYRGAGPALYAQRSVIRRGIISPEAADVAYSQKTALVSPGSFAVGATIMTLTMNVAKGERGFITFTMPFKGGNGTTQNLQLSIPDGITVPTVPGQSPLNTPLPSADGLASRVVPFYASSDVYAGTFALINQAGVSLTASSHSSLSVVLS